MPNEGNGRTWHVGFAGTVAKDVKTLHRLAKETGLGEAYIDAIRFAIHRMQHDPLNFGELIKRLPKSQMVIHVRVVMPVRFEFAIHEDTHRVLIQSIQFML
jgi:hypothetical protein